MVHRPVIAEHAAALARRRQRGQHRIARRRSQPLPHSIRDANHEHVRPACRQRHQGADQRRQAVAKQDDRFADAGAIRPPARDDFEDAARRIRGAFNNAERDRRPAEHLRDEDRKQRIDRFSGGVGEQAHPSEQPDGSWKAFRLRLRAHARNLRSGRMRLTSLPRFSQPLGW